MPTADDVRRIALSLPGATERPDGGRYLVDGKLFAWPWMERVDPRKARVLNAAVLCLRVAGELDKEALIEMHPRVFFTEPHYNGYAAVQVRLAEIDSRMLRTVITQAWR